MHCILYQTKLCQRHSTRCMLSKQSLKFFPNRLSTVTLNLRYKAVPGKVASQATFQIYFKNILNSIEFEWIHPIIKIVMHLGVACLSFHYKKHCFRLRADDCLSSHFEWMLYCYLMKNIPFLWRIVPCCSVLLHRDYMYCPMSGCTGELVIFGSSQDINLSQSFS